MKYIFYSFIKFLNIRLAHCIRLMYQRIHENSKSEWAIRPPPPPPASRAVTTR